MTLHHTGNEVPPPDRRPVTIVDRLCKLSAPSRMIRSSLRLGMMAREGWGMPVEEHYVSTSRVLALTTWGCTAFLVATAWIAWLVFDQSTLAALLCMTGGSMSAAAAVMTIRCYAIRLGRLIRVTAGLSESDVPPNLRIIP